MENQRKNNPENNTSPTTQQMRRLARISVTSAQEHRDLRRKPGRYYGTDTLGSMTTNDVSDELLGLDHKVGIDLNRIKTGFMTAVWRLRYIDVNSIQRLNGEHQKMKAMYDFEWNEQGVYIAKRTLSTMTDAFTPDVDYFLDHLAIKDDALTIVAAEADFENVTKGDCDRLIDETTQYYQQVKETHQAKSLL